MKIEKISDNQIKCTLNKSDLASRQIKISELAYGTEKAKNLFRDMMQQASYEFGFEAEDIPLMIEAIPVSSDCIVLVITKVEDPEELDTRFSKFTSSDDESAVIEDVIEEENDLNGADEILDIFKHIKENVAENKSNFIPLPKTLVPSKEQSASDKKEPKLNNSQNIIKLFSFDNLDTIIQLSYTLKDLYRGNNSLYKSPGNGRYYLLVNKSLHTPEEFNKVCNILSEYGDKERSSYASKAFFKEHYIKVVDNSALQKLSLI
jgi:adapter protein MecA 1/2